MGNKTGRDFVYFCGPVPELLDLGLGEFYMVTRVNGVKGMMIVEETPWADHALSITIVEPDGTLGSTFEADTVLTDKAVYDYSQTSAGDYDRCKCGQPKAASNKRCPMCRMERRERRQRFARKVIRRYKASLQRRAWELQEAERLAAEYAAMDAELDILRPTSEITSVETTGDLWPIEPLALRMPELKVEIAPVTMFCKSVWATMFPTRKQVEQQLALPLKME